MAFELRVPTDEEFGAYIRPVWRGFGMPEPDPEVEADQRIVLEIDRTVGALDGADWVGGAAAFSFELTVPGGAATPVAGVTMVGVASTHRRQGILTALMAQQLDDVAGRGEVAAVLTASETNIYGRYGYGWAASAAEVAIATDRSRFRTEPSAPGRLRIVDVADAAEPIRLAYEACRFRRAGTVSRSAAKVRYALLDRERWRDGASALFVVVHDDPSGQPDGFATYRIKESWPHALPQSDVVVDDLYGATPEIEAVLWRYLLDIDLAATVTAEVRPVDDPIRWRLLEPRQLRTKMVADMLWVRLLDVPRALGLRTYGATDSLVIEVVDRFRPASGGRFRLEAAADGVEVTATSNEPDLVLGAEDLGSIYLGGVAPTALAQAARIEQRTPGALARADALFVTPLAPFSGTMF